MNTRDPACCGTCAAIVSALTPEQLVKAPGQDGDLLLTRGTVVEADWPTESRLLHYVDEGGYQLTAEDVGNGSPYSWGDGRIVRVLTEDKHAQEPVLPRRIKPEDVRVGMVVERRKGEAAVRDRAEQIDGELAAPVFSSEKYAAKGDENFPVGSGAAWALCWCS